MCHRTLDRSLQALLSFLVRSAFLLSALPLIYAAEKLDVGLLQESGRVAVFVCLRDQIFDARGGFERFCSEHSEKAKRLEIRERVVEDLKLRSKRSYISIRPQLTRLIKKGMIRRVQRY